MSVFRDGRSLAIVNPAAGGGRASRHMEQIVRIFKDEGARVDVVRTPAPGEATRLARQALADGYSRIIAIGGDGTVHEVVNGIYGEEAELAIIPLGSGNDFAHALGIREWQSAAKISVTGKPRRVDVALANGRAFINCAGVGVDAAGARVVARHKRLIGPLGYVTAAIGTLATYRPKPLRVHLDGETIIGRHLLVVAANSEHFANGMKIAPGASVDDGMLDLCVIGDTGVLEGMVLLARVYRGQHVGRPKVRMARASEIVIEQEHVLPLQLDGEVGSADRVEVRLVPGGLTVIAP